MNKRLANLAIELCWAVERLPESNEQATARILADNLRSEIMKTHTTPVEGPLRVREIAPGVIGGEQDKRCEVLSEQSFATTTRSYASYLRANYNDLSSAEAEAAAKRFESCADAIELLADVFRLIKTLHESAQPDMAYDLAVIPGDAFYAFVDGHAKLLWRANVYI